MKRGIEETLFLYALHNENSLVFCKKAPNMSLKYSLKILNSAVQKELYISCLAVVVDYVGPFEYFISRNRS